MLVEDPRAVLVGEPAMHDGVVLGVDDHAHRLVRSAVRHDLAVAPVPFQRDGRQLLGGELRTEGVAAERAAARRHDLEEVGALLDEQARGVPDAVHAVGFGAHEPAVAAANRYRSAGGEHPRAVDDALFETVLEAEGGLVPAAAVADGCHAGLERRSYVVRGAQEADGVIVGQVDVLAAPAVAGHVRVRVAVDEARQERRVGEVEDVPVRGRASEAGPTDTMRERSMRTTTSVAAGAPVPSRSLPAWMVSEPFERCMASPLSLRGED